MARLSRVTQTIFASLAGLDQIAEFGSLAQGSPAFTTDPAAAQTATFAAGWFSAVLGNNSPAMEDVNALFFVVTYQLAYLMQLGVPEWNSTTTYYIGSLVQDGTGKTYVSRTDSNTNNTLSSATNWKAVGGAIMTALGDLVYGDTNGAATRLAGNTTTTKKYLTQTGDGANSAAPTWTALPNPTIQRLTSGSGTYTTPAGVRYIKVRLIGGGGGGGGSGVSSSGGTGGDGGNTTFGTSLLTANGGSGAGAGNPGVGGSPTVNSPAVTLVSSSGGYGNPGQEVTGTSQVFPIGGSGASTPFAGGGVSQTDSVGVNAPVNSGAGGGGGGGGESATSPNVAGAGGGGGAFIEVNIVNPSATYSYAVGSAGGGGSAGTSGHAGGAGGSGVIIVEEFYQ